MDLAYCLPTCAAELADPIGVAAKYVAPFDTLMKSLDSPSHDSGYRHLASKGFLKLGMLNDSVAVVTLCGILTPEYQADFRALLLWAMNQSGVEEILLLVNSPGGSAIGTEETAVILRGVESRMPVTAAVQGMCTSGAYYICSQATKIVATPSSLIGSVGTILVLADYSKLYEAAGIRLVPIATAPGKALGLTGKVVTDEDVAVAQKRVNAIQQLFISTLRRSPRLSDDQLIEAANAEVHLAEDAKQLGFVDEVRLLEFVIQDLTIAYSHKGAKTYGDAAVVEAMNVLGLTYRISLTSARLDELHAKRPALAAEVKEHLEATAKMRRSYDHIFNRQTNLG